MNRRANPFARALTLLGWTTPYAARKLGVTLDRARRCAEGVNSRGNPAPAPEPILRYLATVHVMIAEIPKPILPKGQRAAKL